MSANNGAADLADQFHVYDWFLLSGIMMEMFCTSCLLFSRAYRSLPVLTIYLGFMSIADTLGGLLYLKGTTSQYWPVFIGVSGAEYFFQVAFMLELLLLLIRPLRSSTSLRTLCVGVLIFTSTLIVAASLSASFAVYRLVSQDVSRFLHFDLGFSLFRVLVFLSLLLGAATLGLRSTSRVASLSALFSINGIVILLCDITREYRGSYADQDALFRFLECVRIASWCIMMILVGRYVLSHERSKALVGTYPTRAPLTLIK